MKIIFFCIFVASSLTFTSCRTVYVATQPTQIEVNRPASPGTKYVWTNGNWEWKRRSNSYNWRNGYWAKPNRNKRYSPGFWREVPGGHHWVAGRWR